MLPSGNMLFPVSAMTRFIVTNFAIENPSNGVVTFCIHKCIHVSKRFSSFSNFPIFFLGSKIMQRNSQTLNYYLQTINDVKLIDKRTGPKNLSENVEKTVFETYLEIRIF